MHRNISLAAVAFLLTAAISVFAQTTKHGPQMGWSSWNTYGVHISDALIRSQADAMVDNGFAAAGYQYINIDDGYFGGRDKETGKLLAHPTRFPKGLKGLCDYVHSKGLKIGIYSDAGINTCGSEGSGDTISLGCGMYNHHDQDMDYWFVENGFDFIKVDYCGGRQLQNAGQPVNDRILYNMVHEALERAKQKAGKQDIRINICRWSFPGTWAAEWADSWRTTGDIWCSWGSVKDIIERNLYLSAFSGAGHFNDMDMLEVGRGLTAEEDRTHFQMWCLMNSPLMIGCNMASINSTTKKLLTNAELIALNQDTLYQQAYVVDNQEGCYLLVRDVEHKYDTMRVAAVYNSTDKEVSYTIDFDKLDLGGKVKIRSITNGLTLTKEYENSYTLKVPAHATRIFRFDAQQRKERTLYEAECAFLSCFHEAGKTGASAVTCDPASGGKKVGDLGRTEDNDLQWRNVYSKEGGKYKCTIYYMVRGTRKLSLQVNGGKVRTFTLSGSDFDNPMPMNCEIELQPGENTIRLFSATAEAYCPDIDRMELEFLEDLLSVNSVEAAEQKPATDRIVDIQGRVVESLDRLPSGTIYIKNNKKRIK